MENEIWRDIIGYEGHYMVSNLGNVASIKFGKFKIMKGSKCGHGYLYFRTSIDGKKEHKSIARSVAQAFPEICGEWFEGCTVDHISTVKEDNRAVNLRVVTLKKNFENPLTISQRRGGRTDEEWEEYQKERRKYFKMKDREDNKEYYAEYKKKYYAEHREKFREYGRKYSKKIYEKRKEWYKEYYQKHKEEIAEKAKQRYMKNKKSKNNITDMWN